MLGNFGWDDRWRRPFAERLTIHDLAPVANGALIHYDAEAPLNPARKNASYHSSTSTIFAEPGA